MEIKHTFLTGYDLARLMERTPNLVQVNYRYPRIEVLSEFGSTSFTYSAFPGCCGMGIGSGLVPLESPPNAPFLIQAVAEALALSARAHSHGKVAFTDNLRHRQYAFSWWNVAEYLGLKPVSDPVPNPNHDGKSSIVMWEYNVWTPYNYGDG